MRIFKLGLFIAACLSVPGTSYAGNTKWYTVAWGQIFGSAGYYASSPQCNSSSDIIIDGGCYGGLTKIVNAYPQPNGGSTDFYHCYFYVPASTGGWAQAVCRTP